MEITLDQIKTECREVLDDAKTCSHVERNSPITPKLARATLALIEAMEEREKSLSGSMWSFESALTNLCTTWNLTDEEINIAICEWRGWKHSNTFNSATKAPLYYAPGSLRTTSLLPSHITGIEALGNMNEAELTLNTVQYRQFADELWNLARVEARTDRTLECYLSATARQRAIALLRVVKPELFV